jgi:translation initiation factor IF-3
LTIDKNDYRVNGKIKARSVRVIDQEGKQAGILDTRIAIDKAEAQGLDLVEISASSTPPVCKIMNFSKFLYEQKKKAKDAQKNQRIIETKQIQLRPSTDIHDLKTKAAQAVRFLQDGNHVRLNLDFRGRELQHLDVGRDTLTRFKDLVGPIAKVEAFPNMEGKRMSMLLVKNTETKKDTESAQ